MGGDWVGTWVKSGFQRNEEALFAGSMAIAFSLAYGPQDACKVIPSLLGDRERCGLAGSFRRKPKYRWGR